MGFLFAADVEKSFDSVDHNFTFATLKKLALKVILSSGLRRYSKIRKAVSRIMEINTVFQS